MRILNIEELRNFARQHAQARKPLIRWIDITKATNWKDFKELKQTFPSADYVKGFVVFNIAGNLYRLIATIRYHDHIVVIENMFSHSEYDRWNP